MIYQSRNQNFFSTKNLFLIFFYFLSINCFAFEPLDIEVGNYADRLLASTNVIIYEEPLQNAIEKIGVQVLQGVRKISPESGNIHFVFRLVDSIEINAYATAGGYLYLTTGLLDAAKSKDEIAFVIAHEMVHSINSHYIKQVRSAHNKKMALMYVTSVGGSVLGGFASISAFGVPSAGASIGSIVTGGLARSAVEAPIKMIVDFGGSAIYCAMVSGYGKEKELEADKFGVQYVKEAGYDPRACISFFKRLKLIEDKITIEEKKRQVSNFFNATPGLSERIKLFEELFPNDNSNNAVKK